MTKLAWDQTGERRFETGVDHGVLYQISPQGLYVDGVAWNGLTTVTESPSGAESNPQYADNIKYLDLQSAEEFGGTIEALTYPDEFGQNDGTASPVPGLKFGQQDRKGFGLVYRTKVGTDVDQNAGYKLHLVYGAKAAPSEKAYGTVNDSPEAIAFSWEFTTTPVSVDVAGLKPTALLTLDSTEVDADALSDLEDILFGTPGADPRLPLPAEVYALFSGTVVEVFPTPPTYNNSTHTLTIPTVAGVVYKINGVAVSGARVITQDTVVTASPTQGHTFPSASDDDWFYDYS